MENMGSVSFLMAFVVLFSTISFTVDMHYCGNSLIDTAVFKQGAPMATVLGKGMFADVAIEHRTGLPDQLFPVVPGDGFESTVYGNNGTLGIHYHDAVTDRVYHRFPVCIQFMVEHLIP